MLVSFPVLRLELMVLEILSSLSYSKQFMRTRPDLFTVSVEGARAMAQMINIKLGTDDAENQPGVIGNMPTIVHTCHF